MKILCITPFFPKNSSDYNGEFVVDSLLALKNEGCEIVVLVMRSWVPAILSAFKPSLKRGVDRDRVPSEISIHISRNFSIPRNYCRWLSNKIAVRRVSNKVEQLSKQFKFDLIHVHSELDAAAAVKVGLKLSIPVVATMHGAETNKRYWRSSEKLITDALEKVSRLILVGIPLMHFFKSKIMKHDHFRIVPNGLHCSDSMLHPKKITCSQLVQIISVSNLSDEGKCIDVTLKALADLNTREKKNWTYTVVGDGVKRSEYEQIAISLGLKDKVRFVGACSKKEVYQYLMQADIFCLPSCREAFGIAHLEAMAHGLLTIGVKGQGPSTFIEHGKTGFLVEPENVGSLAEILIYAVENLEKMRSIAEAGKQHVLRDFTWESHAEKLIIVYKEVCQ